MVMYTLRRNEDGKLCGSINKNIWGQFRTRKAAIEWARQQATRRRLGPDTDKLLQIVIDEERCFRKRVNEFFTNATITLDSRHAQERSWKADKLFHEESSEELAEWFEPLNTLLLGGQVDALVKRLWKIRKSISKRGSNTKNKRNTLVKQIKYFEERQETMCYDEYCRDDLVLATGVIEGACRCVVGERFEFSGMHWTLEGAEPLLHLRCIQVNGNRDEFITWFADQLPQK